VRGGSGSFGCGRVDRPLSFCSLVDPLIPSRREWGPLIIHVVVLVSFLSVTYTPRAL